MKLNRGDILIEKSGGGEKTPVGRVVMYELDLDRAVYANFMEKLVVREGIVPEYCLYLLTHYYNTRVINKYIKQTTGLQNLDLTTMMADEFLPLPPIEEQKSIVEHIERKVAEIDGLAEALRREIGELRELRQRIVSDAVTGKCKV